MGFLDENEKNSKTSNVCKSAAGSGRVLTESKTENENRNKTKNRALIGAWFKRVPIRFFGSEKLMISNLFPKSRC